MAWSVWPSRHGRPAVSETTTPRRTPVRRCSASRSRAALASGSAGSRSTVPGATLELSTPAAASTSPIRVRTIRVGPRRATVRTVSAVITCSRSAAGAVRPSALLTILEVTTRMSPSASGPAGSSATAAARAAARSVCGPTSPMPAGAKMRDHAVPDLTA